MGPGHLFKIRPTHSTSAQRQQENRDGAGPPQPEGSEMYPSCSGSEEALPPAQRKPAQRREAAATGSLARQARSTPHPQAASRSSESKGNGGKREQGGAPADRKSALLPRTGQSGDDTPRATARSCSKGETRPAARNEARPAAASPLAYWPIRLGPQQPKGAGL